MKTFYGVWVGRNSGVYDNWNDCKAQVEKYSGAKYAKLKATNLTDAEKEFKSSNNVTTANSSNTKHSSTTQNNSTANISSNGPIENVLTVDGAANGVCCEFQAVWYPSKEVAFASKQFSGGTNNIAEFLGLVLAVKHLQENNLPLQIYTDSVTAMAWFRDKKANTTARSTGKATEELDGLLGKAESYLKENAEKLKNVQVMKWETKQWGEIPADYGRK
jgi:ribonuclease HI